MCLRGRHPRFGQRNRSGFALLGWGGSLRFLGELRLYIRVERGEEVLRQGGNGFGRHGEQVLWGEVSEQVWCERSDAGDDFRREIGGGFEGHALCLRSSHPRFGQRNRSGFALLGWGFGALAFRGGVLGWRFFDNDTRLGQPLFERCASLGRNTVIEVGGHRLQHFDGGGFDNLRCQFVEQLGSGFERRRNDFGRQVGGSGQFDALHLRGTHPQVRQVHRCRGGVRLSLGCFFLGARFTRKDFFG